MPTEGSGGNTDDEDAIISRTITEYTNDRVTTIGNYAFNSCANLKSVNFTACTSIGISAFGFCKNLKSVNFPVCTTISNTAFGYCYSLTSVSFPACTTMGVYAFSQCSGLKSVNFPVCTTIGGHAFARCSSLTSVNFPACTSIDTSTFLSCANLTTVSFPACTTIGSYAFQSCSSLTSVSFPVCTSIQGMAFAYCSSLTSVNLPVCTSISTNAFSKCYRLSSITLGASKVCTLGGSNAFSSTPYKGYSTYFSGTPYIYVPASLVNSYKTATNWTYFSNYIVAVDETPGDDSNEIITFFIRGATYQAEEGMTWGEWVDSEYNTLGLVIANGCPALQIAGVSYDYIYMLDETDDTYIDVYDSDVIINEYEYLLTT